MFCEASPDRRFVLKMQLRKALGVLNGLRPHVSDKEEDVIVLKLVEARCCGLPFDTPGRPRLDGFE